MSARAGLRLLNASRAARVSLRQPFRRRVQTSAGVNAEATSSQSGFTKLWNSPVGPKTVHFWAPIMKWALVLAGVADFARPAETLSLSQNLALMATGAIWTRWCFIIKPRNLFLAAVNFFLFCVGGTQVTRIFFYHQSQKNSTFPEEAAKAAREEKETVHSIAADPAAAAQKAVKP